MGKPGQRSITFGGFALGTDGMMLCIRADVRLAKNPIDLMTAYNSATVTYRIFPNETFFATLPSAPTVNVNVARRE